MKTINKKFLDKLYDVKFAVKADWDAVLAIKDYDESTAKVCMAVDNMTANLLEDFYGEIDDIIAAYVQEDRL